MRCHSACHVRRSARWRLTSNDGSSSAVVIINLSLPMQEAKHTFRFCVGSLVWARFFCWSRCLFDRLCGLGSAALRCFFLLGSLFGECLEIADQSQFCWCLAFRLMFFGTDETLRRLPLGQAETSIGAISLLQFSCRAITNPFTVAEQRNTANISGVVPKIVLDSFSVSINTLNSAQLC